MIQVRTFQQIAATSSAVFLNIVTAQGSPPQLFPDCGGRIWRITPYKRASIRENLATETLAVPC
jgi:hypothetical protein